MRISGHTKLYCLIGDPVGHSLSPVIMNRAFRQLEMNAVYTAARVDERRLREAVAGLQALGVQGANVTYPYKEGVLPLIDHPSKRTEVLGAANTLRFGDSGIWGYNTDAAGTAIALEGFAGLSLEGERALIFGAGGAARAAAYGVLEAGVATVVFCVRDASKAEEAIAPLRELFGDAGLSTVSLDEREARDQRQAAFADSSIIINATSVGMIRRDGPPDDAGGRVPSSEPAPEAPTQRETAGSPLIEDATWIRPDHCCFDFVYTPADTAFLGIARKRGALCLGGVSLLVAQAVEGFRCWTGRTLDLEEMGKALELDTGRSVIARRE